MSTLKSDSFVMQKTLKCIFHYINEKTNLNAKFMIQNKEMYVYLSEWLKKQHFPCLPICYCFHMVITFSILHSYHSIVISKCFSVIGITKYSIL